MNVKRASFWQVGILFLSCCFLSGCSEKENRDVAAWNGDAMWTYGAEGRRDDTHDVICHALGAIGGGDSMSNSLEAFLYNYERGFRVFEVDLALTSDNVMVLRHDWDADLGQADDFGWEGEERPIPDLETFMNGRIYDEYTPLSLEDVYRLMDEYDDVWLVLDPKDAEDRAEQFSLIVDTALDHGYEAVLDRVIVQLYSEDMLETVRSVYPFRNWLFTMYYSGYYEGVGAFCEKNGIGIVALPAGWITETVMEEQSKYPVEIWAYTVNDEEIAKKLAAMGVRGLYSDVLLPEEWKEIRESAD